MTADDVLGFDAKTGYSDDWAIMANDKVIMRVPSHVNPLSEDFRDLRDLIAACAKMPSRLPMMVQRREAQADELSREEIEVFEAYLRGNLLQVSIDGRPIWSSDEVADQSVADLEAAAEMLWPKEGRSNHLTK